MNEDDRLRLQHMRDFAREVQSFIAGETRQSLDQDVRLVRALSMSIGIIGEAAANLTTEFRDTSPEIPWRSIIGMRNFLIHAYFNVDLDILWNTASISILQLLQQLETLLSDTSD